MAEAGSNRRVWLTGASSGIGAALARELASRGARVAVFARRKDRLEELRAEFGDNILVQPGDVTNRKRVAEAVAEAEEAFGGIDVAILNAGTGDSMSLDAIDTDLVERILRINFLGAVYGLEAVVPGMLKRKSGTIVGISSPAGFRGLPTSAPYGASKAALTVFLESLRHEAPAHGLKILTVSPGFVKSELTDRNEHPMPFLMSSRQAARIILKGIDKGTKHIHFPWRMTVPLYLMRAFPAGLFDLFVRRVVAPRAREKRKS